MTAAGLGGKRIVGVGLLWACGFAGAWLPDPSGIAPVSEACQGASGALMFRFDGARVVDVLHQFALMMGMTPVIVDPDIQGRVYVYSRAAVPLNVAREVFDLFLKKSRAAVIKVDDVYQIVPVASGAMPGSEQPGNPIAIPPVKPISRGSGVPVQPKRVSDHLVKVIKWAQPIYPEEAKQKGIDGRVILQVIVDENGTVIGEDVIKGDLLLHQAAVNAVRQWRYSPVLIEGKAVPVAVFQKVDFSAASGAPVVQVDETGGLRDTAGLTGAELKTKLMDRKIVYIRPTAKVTFAVLEKALQGLADQNIRDISMIGASPYRFTDGHLFHWASAGSRIQLPVLSVDNDRLAAMAKDSGRLGLPQGVAAVIHYMVSVDESGKIISVKCTSEPEIPEITTALRNAQVRTPGLLDNVPLAVSFDLVIRAEF